MISLILIVLLLFGFLRGLKRGFILQTFHLVGFIIAFLVARIYYKGLAGHMDAWIHYPELICDASLDLFVNNFLFALIFYYSLSIWILFVDVIIYIYFIFYI